MAIVVTNKIPLIRNKQVRIDSDWDLDGNTLFNAPNPTADDHVANKAYVDSVAAGLDPKASVRFATTENITGYDLDNNTFPIGSTSWSQDGIEAQDGDRVLVKDQFEFPRNGIYTVSGVGTSVVLTRSSDFDGTPTHEVSAGNYTFVETGDTLGGTGWVVLGDGIIDVNTDPIVWTQFSESTSLTAGDGISVYGGNINVSYNGAHLSIPEHGLLSVNTTPMHGLNLPAANITGLGSFIFDEEKFEDSSTIDFTVVSGLGVTAEVKYDNDTIKLNNDVLSVDKLALNLSASDISDLMSTVFHTDNFEDGNTIDFTVTPGSDVTAEVKNGTIDAGKFNTIGNKAPGKILAATGTNTLEWKTVDELITPYTGIGAISISGNNINLLYDDTTIKLNTSDKLYVDGSELSVPASNITGLTTAINNEVFESSNFIKGDSIEFSVTEGSSVSANVIYGSIGAKELDTTGTTKAPGSILVATSDTVLAWTLVYEVENFNIVPNSISSGVAILSSNSALNEGDLIKPNSYPELYVNGVKYRLGEDNTADAWLANSGTTAIPFSQVNDSSLLVWSETISNKAIDGNDKIIFRYTAVPDPDF